MANIAMILSGCGHQDGAEIRESVLSLLYLDQKRANVSLFAPDIDQTEVIDHRTGQPVAQKRNALAEAARIARGHIRPLSEVRAADFDALVLPGGFGAAKNLSDFASAGENITVLPELKRLIIDFHAQKKPIAAICIAPLIVAAALAGRARPMVTVGEDESIAAAIRSWGGEHWNCPTTGCAIDRENMLVTCPAYMRDARLSAIAEGIEKTIEETLNLAAWSKRALAA